MKDDMKLYLIHCGYYDNEIGAGIFESHTNFFVVACSPQEARHKAKEKSYFRNKKMHIDGIQEIKVVDGYKIVLEYDLTLENLDQIESIQFRDLAPKNNQP